MNVWRTTDNLDGFGASFGELRRMSPGIDLAKAQVGIRDFLGTNNFNDINTFIFRRKLDNFFDFNETRTNKFNKLFGRKFSRNLNVFFDTIERN